MPAVPTLVPAELSEWTTGKPSSTKPRNLETCRHRSCPRPPNAWDDMFDMRWFSAREARYGLRGVRTEASHPVLQFQPLLVTPRGIILAGIHLPDSDAESEDEQLVPGSSRLDLRSPGCPDESRRARARGSVDPKTSQVCPRSSGKMILRTARGPSPGSERVLGSRTCAQPQEGRSGSVNKTEFPASVEEVAADFSRAHGRRSRRRWFRGRVRFDSRGFRETRAHRLTQLSFQPHVMTWSHDIGTEVADVAATVVDRPSTPSPSLFCDRQYELTVGDAETGAGPAVEKRPRGSSHS